MKERNRKAARQRAVTPLEFVSGRRRRGDPALTAAPSWVKSKMRQAKILLVAWATLAGLGCEDVLLTHSAIGAADAILDDRLLGTWGESGDQGSDILTIRRNGEVYVGLSNTSGETEELNIGLTRIGGRLLLQVTEQSCSDHLFFDEHGDETCFLVFRLELDQERFRLAPLDHERLFQDSLAAKLPISHEIRREVKFRPPAASSPGPGRKETEPGKPRSVYTCVVLTAPTAELRRGLAAYTADESVFGDAMTFVRRTESVR